MRPLLVLALVLLVAAGCGGDARKVPPGAVALVGDHPISRAAFEAELARARRARGNGHPLSKTVRDAALRLLVDRERLEIEAEQAHVSVSRAQVDARLRAFKRTTFGGDERRFRDQLRRTGMTEADVRAAIRAELLAAALRGVDTSAPEVTYAPGFEPASPG